MAKTRKVRVKAGYGAVHMDGQRYGAGQVFGISEESYQALKGRLEVVGKNPEVKDEAEVDETPESLVGLTASDLRGMNREELRELAHDVGVTGAASMNKEPLIDALVAKLPEDARE